MALRNSTILLLIVTMSCSIKEDYIEENRSVGLYIREFYDTVEYICLKEDSTYEYFTEDSILASGIWHYARHDGKSNIELNDFDYSMALKKKTKYSSYSIPIKYSHAKSAVLLRMNADDHFMDFVRVDSSSCVTD